MTTHDEALVEMCNQMQVCEEHDCGWTEHGEHLLAAYWSTRFPDGPDLATLVLERETRDVARAEASATGDGPMAPARGWGEIRPVTMQRWVSPWREVGS